MTYAPSDISVVIPVGNGSPLARKVLAAIATAAPPPGEVIVVNDRVADGSLAGVTDGGLARVIANGGPRGPAAARNAGARVARGPLILFVDADVFVRPDVFARLAAAYGDDGADAVLGVEAEAALPNLPSRYKNLWMRYTYLRLPRAVDLFYTSCASVKKDVFLAAGGFDEGYTRPSVEDTAFGRALAARGAAVVLEKSIEVEHRKIYNASAVIVAAFRRAAALTRCVLRIGRRPGGNRTSVPTAYILATPLAVLLFVELACVPFAPAAGAAAFGATLAVFYLLNGGWVAFLAARGAPLLFWAFLFLPLESAAGFAGGAWGALSFYLLRSKY